MNVLTYVSAYEHTLVGTYLSMPSLRIFFLAKKAVEKACWKRFAVNDCVSRARQQRRQTQDRLRQQELALNALERRLAAQPDDPAASQPPASRQP